MMWPKINAAGSVDGCRVYACFSEGPLPASAHLCVSVCVSVCVSLQVRDSVGNVKRPTGTEENKKIHED